MNYTYKLVSVVIPTYGGSAYLDRCIDSVLSQSYNEIEVIVVDDNGSGTPYQIETSKIMKKYDGNPSVKYICHEVNKNGSAARNTGVRNSKGEYIALLDDDDVFRPDKIERQVELLESLPDDYAFVYCSHELYHNDVLVKTERAKNSGYLFYEKLLNKFSVQTSGVLIRRKVFEEFNGFDESFRRHQDWEFIARVMSKYKIKADDFLGYTRYLYGRSDAMSPEQSKERRMHYLDKMQPYLSILSSNQREDFNNYHRIDIAFKYLKARKYTVFFTELVDAKLGLRGLSMLLSILCSRVF